MPSEHTLELSEDDILSDDLLPNPGGSEVFSVEPDQDTVQEASDERAMVHGAAPLFDYILDWFDQEIEESGRLESIDLKSPVPVDSQILARQLLVRMLLEARSGLKSLKDEHIK